MLRAQSQATQFFLNLPFGETMIEQMDGSYDNPFKFNAKELDDNPVNMVLNNRMMKSLVPTVKMIEATDGLQAVKQCKDHVFDLILMDVQLPVMNGIEATKQIRLLPEYINVPIIGVTAGNIFEEKEKCLNSGMNDFLPKP